MLRGLYHRDSKRKLKILENDIVPMLDNIVLDESDWLQAARFWADTVSQGRQLSDVDLLIAAIVYRRNSILVTSDQDFAVLPIKHINWRNP